MLRLRRDYVRSLLFFTNTFIEISPIVLITRINEDFKDFKLNDMFESKKIDNLKEALQQHAPDITKSHIHPHFNFKGLKDYPNGIKSSL